MRDHAEVVEYVEGFPESVRGLTILPVNELPGLNNQFLSAYTIHIKVEPREYADDDTTEHYKCDIYNENTLVLTIPAMDYALREAEEACDDALEDHPRVTFALQHFRNDALGASRAVAELRRFREIRIQFPSGTVLTTEGLTPNPETNLPPTYFQVDSVFTSKANSQVKMKDDYMFWTVVRGDKKPEKRGKLPTQSKKSMGAEAFFRFHSNRAGADDGSE